MLPGELVAARYEILEASQRDRFVARDRLRGDDVSLEIVRGPKAWLDQTLGALARVAASESPELSHLRRVGRVDRSRGFLVVERLAGPSLADADLGWRELAAALAGALVGLEALHRLGVRHGRFEPDRIVATSAGPRLAELAGCRPFGICERLTGTPAFLAPELVAGRQADGRADLFSLGVILRQLGERLGEVPPTWRALEAQLLQAAPERRPPDALTVAGALQSLATDGALDLGDATAPHAVAVDRVAQPRDLASLARTVRETPEAIAASDAAAELVEDLLAADDLVAVEAVLAATAAARRAHPTSWLSAARGIVAAFPSVPAMLAAIDVLAASHPGEALAAIALLRRGRRIEPAALYRRAGLAYLALGRDDRALHYLRRMFPSARTRDQEIAHLRREVEQLRARCRQLEQAATRAPAPSPRATLIDTRAARARREDERLHAVLRETAWNVSETARRLGISRPTVYRRMRRLRHEG